MWSFVCDFKHKHKNMHISGNLLLRSSKEPSSEIRVAMGNELESEIVFEG